ncbi:flagellar hook protein FlgE [Fimbriimonadia bacterium ATM]|nr:MAG: flagellar hook protein FlgE [Armatimonadota bacterium]MBC6968493.1 flagellar hook protein FlgE [Armatimonadota bacterium]MCE7898668.1 flagellar hook protein FlgE [Armatimonadetes bacterium ATM1]MDL1928039.1 flagellar hook protein FlgE [Fimbriimonadia bacterium ATM]RIJ98390.1 MAG: flagellar hook-basal body protein [Armatimonadota bacterium]
MLQALLAGVASIKAQQTRMNVIGNNLANVNTTAYKGSRVTFQEMIAQTIRGATRPQNNGLGGTNPVQYGLGVIVGGTDTNLDQGSLQSTNKTTDLAVQGNGYFLVANGERVAYTRDGGFDLDASGSLVQRTTGERLLGWSADSFGNIDTNVPISPSSTLTIPLGSLKAVQVTTAANFAGNLYSAASPAESWESTFRVYDSLGGSHDINITFTNHQVPPVGTPPPGAVASWDWSAVEGSTPVGDSSTSGEPLYFDAQGNLINATAVQQVTVPSANGAPPFVVDLGFSAISQLNTETQVQMTDQNGFPPGSLANFSIGVDGTITGLFTNGLTRSLGLIAMSIFPNPAGLERIGNNLWRNTDNSGVPVVGPPRSAGRGSINAGFLEQSNVDLGSEFTNLIVTQRGFQANTRVVTTVDEMLQDLLSMKR